MGTVKSLLERSREFEEAHCSCRELMEDQLQTIEDYTKKWLLIGLAALFIFQIFSVAFFYYKFSQLEKIVFNKFDLIENKIDYRYFLTKDSLEDIHKVKIENGRVIWQQPSPSSSINNAISNRN